MSYTMARFTAAKRPRNLPIGLDHDRNGWLGRARRDGGAQLHELAGALEPMKHPAQYAGPV